MEDKPVHICDMGSNVMATLMEFSPHPNLSQTMNRYKDEVKFKLSNAQYQHEGKLKRNFPVPNKYADQLGLREWYETTPSRGLSVESFHAYLG